MDRKKAKEMKTNLIFPFELLKMNRQVNTHTHTYTNTHTNIKYK
jgi:hypothetical protein